MLSFVSIYAIQSRGESQRKGPGDCLAKTQVIAKVKAEV